jgi:hypothetical protein
MNTLSLLFINILILALSSVNFIFLNESFQIMIQDDNNVYLASTNGTFTESESRIPSSAEEYEETSIISDNETSQEAQTLQNQEPFIEKAIKAKVGDNKSSTTSNVSKFYNLRNSYLAEWEKIPLQSAFDTFINENSTQGYGIFTERNSSIFNPSQRISLYVEPIGVKHESIIDTKGNKLYLTNITTIITMEDDKGNEVPSIEDLQDYILKSHNIITELYLPIDLDLTSSLSTGSYVITYTLIDNISKEYFNIQKNITIS